MAKEIPPEELDGLLKNVTEVRERNATHAERERCLSWIYHISRNGPVGATDIAVLLERIKSGAVAPDRGMGFW